MCLGWMYRCLYFMDDDDNWIFWVWWERIFRSLMIFIIWGGGGGLWWMVWKSVEEMVWWLVVMIYKLCEGEDGGGRVEVVLFFGWMIYNYWLDFILMKII